MEVRGGEYCLHHHILQETHTHSSSRLNTTDLESGSLVGQPTTGKRMGEEGKLPPYLPMEKYSWNFPSLPHHPPMKKYSGPQDYSNFQ